MTVAVLDTGGCPIALHREDGSSLLRPKIAEAKAWGALGMGMGGRALAERAAHAPAFMQALTAVSDGRVVPVPGGVLIRNAEGELLGAVGVSGANPDVDEACASHGIASLGLVADCG